jgi:hypothetical protein
MTLGSCVRRHQGQIRLARMLARVTIFFTPGGILLGLPPHWRTDFRPRENSSLSRNPCHGTDTGPSAGPKPRTARPPGPRLQAGPSKLPRPSRCPHQASAEGLQLPAGPSPAGGAQLGGAGHRGPGSPSNSAPLAWKARALVGGACGRVAVAASHHEGGSSGGGPPAGRAALAPTPVAAKQRGRFRGAAAFSGQNQG